MTEIIQKKLSDSVAARWIALVLLASAMLFAYMFVDVLSPLKSMLESHLNWDSISYGTFTSSEYFLNICGFMIVAGIILDKMGVRFTAMLSGSVMVIGATIKYYAVSEYFAGTGLESALDSFWPSFPASAKLASLGFMIFGCGTEMAGVTVSKGIVKWFKGKELALAMGVEMAIARLGVAFVVLISPRIAEMHAVQSVSRPVLFCTLLLLIGLINFGIYALMDRKLEKQIGESGEEPEEPFKLRDLGKLFASKTFLIVAGLCVLYYSAIFPFQKYAINMLECNLGLSASQAGNIFFFFPLGAAFITPFLGSYLDRKGRGATMLMIGAVLMTICHLTFALVPLTEPIAYAAIILLGISFSLVPAALWPSVPKLVENRYLGSAYSIIFWIQNIGLGVFPILIGFTLNITNVGVTDPTCYNYTVPMLIFASLGVVAFFLGLWLKHEDTKHHYGLEEPNIKK